MYTDASQRNHPDDEDYGFHPRTVGIVYPFEKDEVEAKIPEKSEEIVTEQLPAEKEETVAETVETDAENAGETEQVESTEVLKESVEAVLSESATTEAAETEN